MTLGKKLKNCPFLAVDIPSLYTQLTTEEWYIYILEFLLCVSCLIWDAIFDFRLPTGCPRGGSSSVEATEYDLHTLLCTPEAKYSASFLCVFIHKKMYTCTHSYKSPQAKNTTFKRNLLPVLRVFDKNICPYDMRKICLQQLYTGRYSI